MTIEELLIYGKSLIHKDHAKMLLAELLEVNSLELLTMLDKKISTDIVDKYKSMVKAVKDNKPIQYVLGNVNFYGNTFYVNENVLIPRFETEELVETVIEYSKKLGDNLDIVDLGTGTGVIGITLDKKLSTNTVDIIDISKVALEVAKINKEKNNSKVILIENDFLEGISKKYDIIVSNPPYIKTNEEIEEIVKNNEPHLALYAGDDGLDCYRKILKNISNNMKDKCLIAFEIGYDQANDLDKLTNEYLKDVKTIVKKDLQGRDRIFLILKNLQ